MITIKMYNANDFKTKVIIEEVLYILRFGWNGYNWSMDIRDNKNNDIVRNIALVPNFPLLIQHQRHLNIKGQLLAIRNDGKSNIGRNDFIEGKASIVYMSLEDLKNAVQTNI